MSDATTIHALEEQLASERQKLKELLARKEALLANIPHKGFRAATTGAHLRSEIEQLSDSIRQHELMLAMARK